MILGTAAYMSPEQARGKKVDRRADLWAFGVVLYEMLTGTRLFAGDTVSDTLAEVLKGDVDWSRLPAATPQSVRRLLRRCLERDRAHRLADAADARLEIEEAAKDEPASGAVASPARAPSRAMTAAVAIVALLSGVLVTWLALRRGPGERVERTALEITGAAFQNNSAAAISPDGRTVAYAPYHPTDDEVLHIRDLGDFSSRTIAGTESASNPFFSPDSRSVGYFDTVRKGLFIVGLSGGAPQQIARVPTYAESATWLDDGRIVSSGVEIDGTRWLGLAIIPRSGGAPKVLTTPGPHERHHTQPLAVPGGKWVLFTVVSSGGFEVDAVSLVDGSRHRVVEAAGSAQYSPTGHLVFYRASDLTVLAARFDKEKARIVGETTVVLPNILRISGGMGAYALSRTGTIIYTTSDRNSTLTGAYSLVWVDRKGAVAPLVDRLDTWTQPRLSPDGRTLLVRQTATPDCTLWTIDLARGTRTRLTFKGDHHSPMWSSSGTGILAAVTTDGFRAIVRKALDAESPEQEITKAKSDLSAAVESPDGKSIVFEMQTSGNATDLYVMNADGSGEPRPFASTPYDELNPRFSPDGRWIAYTSDESGRPEVYIKPFHAPGAKFQVSTEGGVGPLWSRDGKELFYASRDRMMAVTITVSPELRASAPRVLFGGKFVWDRADNYDITPDGQRFVMVQRTADEGTTEQLRVVLNWTAELEKKFAK
jgi:Tol biopolymer transport system component